MLHLHTDFRLPRRHRAHILFSEYNERLCVDRSLNNVLAAARDLGYTVVLINGIYPCATVPLTEMDFQKELNTCRS